MYILIQLTVNGSMNLHGVKRGLAPLCEGVSRGHGVCEQLFDSFTLILSFLLVDTIVGSWVRGM